MTDGNLFDLHQTLPNLQPCCSITNVKASFCSCSQIVCKVFRSNEVLTTSDSACFLISSDDNQAKVINLSRRANYLEQCFYFYGFFGSEKPLSAPSRHLGASQVQKFLISSKNLEES